MYLQDKVNGDLKTRDGAGYAERVIAKEEFSEKILERCIVQHPRDDELFRHLIVLSRRHIKGVGHGSTSELLSASLILDRPEIATGEGFGSLDAIDRVGADWMSAVTAVRDACQLICNEHSV